MDESDEDARWSSAEPPELAERLHGCAFQVGTDEQSLELYQGSDTIQQSFIMSGGKSNNNNAQSKKIRAEAQAIAKAVAAAMAEKPKQPPKRKERKERREPSEKRVLALNAPQVVHSLSTFFRFRAGSTPQSIVIEGRDLGATNISASSATPATFTVQYNGISCAAVSPIVALLTRDRKSVV